MELATGFQKTSAQIQLLTKSMLLYSVPASLSKVSYTSIILPVIPK